MGFAEQLRILEAAKGIPALLALATVDLAHQTLPPVERQRIKDALLAAAVPHWCDRDVLAALLQTTPKETDRLFGELNTLTVIEPFPARGKHAINVHETARLALREHLRTANAPLWQALSARARAHVAQSQEPHARIEALYHLFATDQPTAAKECEALDREFSVGGRPEVRHALALSLWELTAAGWLTGAARVEALNELERLSLELGGFSAPVAGASVPSGIGRAQSAVPERASRHAPMPRIEKTVFISYRRTDRAWAQAIFQDLSQNGHDAFIDYDGIASGKFETVIFENITARAHFLVVLTPTALELCSDPKDWMRREIEVALGSKRNIVPLMLQGFKFNTPAIINQLIAGKLTALNEYNGLDIPDNYFTEAMERLRSRFLNMPVDAVLHSASVSAQKEATEQSDKAVAAPPKLKDGLHVSDIRFSVNSNEIFSGVGELSIRVFNGSGRVVQIGKISGKVAFTTPKSELKALMRTSPRLFGVPLLEQLKSWHLVFPLSPIDERSKFWSLFDLKDEIHL
jgi:hypothetical protein